jgi:hypothetical protein
MARRKTRENPGMINASQVKEHMEVICSNGGHVGTVDHVEGDRIKMTRSDKSAGGQHHYLPLSAVAGIEAGKLKLNVDGQRAKQMMQQGMQSGMPQPGHEAGMQR